MGVEAGVGPDGQLSRRAGVAHPADRLAQEVAGAPARVGTALAQAPHEHVTRARRDRLGGRPLYGKRVINRRLVSLKLDVNHRTDDLGDFSYIIHFFTCHSRESGNLY